MRLMAAAIVARPADASSPGLRGAGSREESASPSAAPRGRHPAPARRHRAGPSSRASSSRSALSPSQRIAAPPMPTSGRHSSAGDDRLRERLRQSRHPSAPAAAPPRVRRRPRAFGGAQRRRKSHFRCSASSSVTSRSGSATASGIPGEPPPEPTSISGSVVLLDERQRPQRIVEQHLPCALRIAKRRQPRRRDYRVRASHSGTTTT